jgi:hypothetical protein
LNYESCFRNNKKAMRVSANAVQKFHLPTYRSDVDSNKMEQNIYLYTMRSNLHNRLLAAAHTVWEKMEI